MATNAPDPTETFGPTRSKAVTEEDVRVSTWVDREVLRVPQVKDLPKERGLMALRLVAAFENQRDPILYLGTAGSLNVSTSELRWGAALSLVNVLFGANDRLDREDEEQKKIDEEVENAAKDEDNKEAEVTDAADTTTQPSSLLDKVAADAGLKLERKDDTVTAPGKTAEAESGPRVENKSPASGTPVEGERPAPSQARSTDKK